MRFKTGLAIGFGVGYVLGAKAGRERYEQIRNAADSLRSNETLRRAASVADRSTRKIRRAAGDGLVVASEKIRERANSDETGEALS